jgi:hypothetical protein
MTVRNHAGDFGTVSEEQSLALVPDAGVKGSEIAGGSRGAGLRLVIVPRSIIGWFILCWAVFLIGAIVVGSRPWAEW